MSDKALILIDVQKCFLPGGSLEVKDSHLVVPMLNKYVAVFKELRIPVYATRDWHPRETKHFKEFGGKWPPHCIRNTEDAEFADDLDLPADVEVVSAGTGPEDEGYSGFEGANEEGTGLDQSLRERGVTHLYIGGIATDYCVKETALEAIQRGYQVTVLSDAIKAVELERGDSDLAIEEMTEAGATLGDYESIERHLRTPVR